jgi:hypothetical protein
MSWTDEEMDELFRNAASEQCFRYKSEYFNDIEVQLPVRKRGAELVWWSSAVGCILTFVALLMTSERTDFASHNSATDSSSLKGKLLKSEVVRRFSQQQGGSIMPEVRNQVIDNNLSSIYETALSPLNEPFNLQEAQIVLQSKEMVSAITSDIGELKLRAADSFSGFELVERTFSAEQTVKHRFSIFTEVTSGFGESPIRNAESGKNLSAAYTLSMGAFFERNKWRLSAGAGITRIHFDNVYIKERSLVYGFGVVNYDNQYHFNSLIALEMPIRVGYRFGPHRVEAGLNTSINLSTTVRYQESIDGVMHREGSGIASTELFDRINFRPELRYSVELRKSWEIGVSAAVQVGSGIASERFKGIENQLPLSGSFSLRRTFDLR